MDSVGILHRLSFCLRIETVSIYLFSLYTLFFLPYCLLGLPDDVEEKGDISVLFPVSRKSLQSFTAKYDISLGLFFTFCLFCFFVDAVYQIEKFFSIPYFLGVLITNGC